MKNLPQPTTSTSLPGRREDAAAALAEAQARLVYECGTPVLLNPIQDGHRRLLERRAEQLARMMAPFRGAEQAARARSALAALFGSNATLSGRDAGALVAAYLTALADLPAWAIESACLRAARGGVPGLNPDFAPTAARLHDLAREAMSDVAAERAKISDVLRARIEPPVDPEMRERVGQLLTGLADELKERHMTADSEDRAAVAATTIARNLADVMRMRRAAGMPDLEPGQIAVSPALVATVKGAA